MRLARLRHEQLGGAYHAMSRVVDGKFLFDVRNPACLEATYFLKLMRRLEVFHGMQVITYALMSNHFHILVREPASRLTEISDGELVERVRALNGDSAAAELQWQIKHLRVELKAPKAVEELKQRYLARMGNISFFVKELKGQFAQWYNKRHGRYGVLWADRFKSVLVQGGEALRTMAAYIDLNCVRANLAEDPKDYRFCGYGAATGGCKIARAGMLEVYGENRHQSWRDCAKAYRKFLFSTGEQHVAEPGKRVRRGISAQRVEKVLEGDGELSVGELVRCRVRYFCDGLALGSAEFIESVFRANRELFGRRRKEGARKLAGGEYGGLRTLRNLRRDPIAARH